MYKRYKLLQDVQVVYKVYKVLQDVQVVYKVYKLPQDKQVMYKVYELRGCASYYEDVQATTKVVGLHKLLRRCTKLLPCTSYY